MTLKHHNSTARKQLPPELLARLQLPRLRNTQRRYQDMLTAAERLGITVDHTEHPADCWWQRVEAAIAEMSEGAYEEAA